MFLIKKVCAKISVYNIKRKDKYVNNITQFHYLLFNFFFFENYKHH